MDNIYGKSEFIADIALKENLSTVNSEFSPINIKRTFYTVFVKRSIDIIVSLLALIITLPINFIICLITIFDVGFPIIFRQLRTGYMGKPFQILKFRNMTNERDINGELLPPNERVTRFGGFVRKYSLDELLNFWSILKGDMSLIGPRPLPHKFYERFSERHKMRYSIRPGLECPSIRPSKSVRLYHQQLEDDIWYVENVSFLVDCILVFRLMQMVFNRKERADHANVAGGDFIGYDKTGMAFSMRRIPTEYEMRYTDYVNSFKERQQCKQGGVNG